MTIDGFGPTWWVARSLPWRKFMTVPSVFICIMSRNPIQAGSKKKSHERAEWEAVIRIAGDDDGWGRRAVASYSVLERRIVCLPRLKEMRNIDQCRRAKTTTWRPSTTPKQVHRRNNEFRNHGEHTICSVKIAISNNTRSSVCLPEQRSSA